jgi:hypothetical protein
LAHYYNLFPSFAFSHATNFADEAMSFARFKLAHSNCHPAEVMPKAGLFTAMAVEFQTQLMSEQIFGRDHCQ